MFENQSDSSSQKTTTPHYMEDDMQVTKNDIKNKPSYTDMHETIITANKTFAGSATIESLNQKSLQINILPFTAHSDISVSSNFVEIISSENLSTRLAQTFIDQASESAATSDNDKRAEIFQKSTRNESAKRLISCSQCKQNYKSVSFLNRHRRQKHSMFFDWGIYSIKQENKAITPFQNTLNHTGCLGGWRCVQCFNRGCLSAGKHAFLVCVPSLALFRSSIQSFFVNFGQIVSEASNCVIF